MEPIIQCKLKLRFIAICFTFLLKGSFKESFCLRRIGAEVTGIAVDESEDAGFRIAVAAFDGCVQVWLNNSRFEQSVVFSVQMMNSIPCMMAYIPNSSHNVYVFSLDNGYM